MHKLLQPGARNAASLLASLIFTVLSVDSLAQGADTAVIYRSGVVNVYWQGVLLPIAKPNETGPIVFKMIDLDEGISLSKTTSTADISLALNARDATFSISAGQQAKVVDAGADRPSHSACIELLVASKGSDTVPYSKAPTKYFCARTADGRTTRFRVSHWRATYQPNDFVDVTAFLDFVTWKAAQ